MHQTIFYLIVGIVIVNYFLGLVLEVLNNQNKSIKVPDTLREFYDQEHYGMSQKYHKEKDYFGLLHSTFSLILLLSMLLFDGFAYLNSQLIPFFDDPKLLSLAFFGVLFLGADLLGIPFSLYNQFIIEERYGFNKSSLGLYFSDKLKNYAISILLGGSLGYLILFIIEKVGPGFWLYSWIIILLFSFLANFLYTRLYIPLFNKLNRLEEGELKAKIDELAAQMGFPIKRIYVINASKRSTKANAFFSGFGRNKSVVLFDTLIEKHSAEELLGILAHEVGHYKKNHILWNVLLGSVQSGVMLYLLSWFIFNPELSYALGASEHFVHLNILAFSVLNEPLNTIFSVFTNRISRKHEFEADRFAVQYANKDEFSKALKRLSTSHLSDLLPHPAYVFFYYSHPTLMQRLQAIGMA